MLIDIRKAIRPLRFIFWGGLFYVFGFKIGISGLKIDLLDDTLGMYFIVYGLRQLQVFFIDTEYQKTFLYIKYIAVSITIISLIQHFTPTFADIDLILSIISSISIIYFCKIMVYISKKYHMNNSGSLWHTTKILYISIYLSISILISLYRILQVLGIYNSINIVFSNSLFAVVGFVIMFVPFFYFLKSTLNMTREAEQVRITDTEILATLLFNADYRNIKRS